MTFLANFPHCAAVQSYSTQSQAGLSIISEKHCSAKFFTFLPTPGTQKMFIAVNFRPSWHALPINQIKMTYRIVVCSSFSVEACRLSLDFFWLHFFHTVLSRAATAATALAEKWKRENRNARRQFASLSPLGFEGPFSEARFFHRGLLKRWITNFRVVFIAHVVMPCTATFIHTFFLERATFLKY